MESSFEDNDALFYTSQAKIIKEETKAKGAGRPSCR